MKLSNVFEYVKQLRYICTQSELLEYSWKELDKN